MDDNEKLIEEAAKAMWAANGPEDWDSATGAEQAEHLTLASAALAVFRERMSHTQTVNIDRAEWERLKAFEKAHTPTDDEREAPEPSAEDFRQRIADERARQVATGYDILHDRLHGIDHLLGWAQDYARRGRTVQAAALVEAARELFAKSPEPQGEPSAFMAWEEGYDAGSEDQAEITGVRHVAGHENLANFHWSKNPYRGAAGGRA